MARNKPWEPPSRLSLPAPDDHTDALDDVGDEDEAS